MISSYIGQSRLKTDTMLEVPLGTRIQAVRTRQGLGLNEAARQCKIAPQKLSDAESGKDSRASTVVAIARGLNVSADYLLGLDETTPRISLPVSDEGLAGMDSLASAHDGIAALGDVLGMVLEVLATVPGLPEHAVEQLRLASEKLESEPDERAS